MSAKTRSGLSVGIINSMLLGEQAWARDCSHYHVRVVQYSRGVHEWWFAWICSASCPNGTSCVPSQKKTKLHSKHLPPQTGKAVSVLWGWRAENPKGGTSLSSMALSKATTCSGRKYHLCLARLFALKISIERTILKKGCQCLLCTTFRNTNDIYNDSDFSPITFHVGRQWNDIIEMI